MKIMLYEVALNKKHYCFLCCDLDDYEGVSFDDMRELRGALTHLISRDVTAPWGHIPEHPEDFKVLVPAVVYMNRSMK